MKRLSLACMAIVGGCTFNVAGLTLGSADLGVETDLATQDLAGADLTGVDLAAADLTVGPEMAPPCTAAENSCAGSTAHVCKGDGSGFVDTVCPLGCNTTGGAHCQLFYPTAPVTRADLDTTGLTAKTFGANTVFHTDTGAIDGARPANNDPAVYEIKGMGGGSIGFHLVGGVAIWTFASMTVASTVTVQLTGPNPAALVASTDLTVTGVLSAQWCGTAVAGGAQGAGSATSGGGLGAGGGGDASGSGGELTTSGGGGAGHGAKGGKGGDGKNGAGATGGGGGALVSFTFAGGSSGGGGGGGGGGSKGGNGGGAIMLVAGGTVTVGGGAFIGGVNAGGCGGQGGTSDKAGGGGGAGGTIFVQAPSVNLAAKGVLASNGGGGGGGDGGQNGGLATLSANGGTLGSGGSKGGDGSVGGDLAKPAGDVGGDQDHGGGGGGAVGRIRIDTRTMSAMIDGTAIVSPAPAQMSIDLH